MTFRDWARVTVVAGDKEAIREAVNSNASFDEDDGTLELVDVNWLPVAAIVAADPSATWYAFVGPDAEDGSAMFVYAAGELHRGCHVDGEAVIGVPERGDPQATAFVRAVQRVIYDTA